LNNLPYFRKSFIRATTSNRAPNAASTWVLHDIRHKLTALELPVNIGYHSDDDFEIKVPQLDQLPRDFPNLCLLSIPYMAFGPIVDTLSEKDRLQSLEILVLTNVLCGCSVETLTTLLLKKDQKPSFLPRLSELKLYHRAEKYFKQSFGGTIDQRLPGHLARVGIQVHEYIPGCCLRIGDEYHHPRKYTKSEIDARQDKRHIKCYKSFSMLTIVGTAIGKKI
jgi:hypothetical protein